MVKRSPVSSEKADVVAQAIAKINRDAKHTVITTADKMPYMYHLRRPSGIMQLDIDTAGGLPAASVCCLSGPDGAGKSDLLLRYMAWQQRIYGDAACLALAHVEHQFDHFKARRLGLKIPIPDGHIEQEQYDRKYRGLPLLTKPEIADLRTGVGRFYIIPPDDMESMMQRVLDLLETGGFQMIGVDSISAMIPADFANKDLDEEQKRGAHAMNLKKFFLKYYGIGGIDNPVETTLVFTQQVSSNDAKSTAPTYMAKYMPEFAVKGGYAGRHGKLIDILLTNGGKVKKEGEADLDGKKEKITTGKVVRWELIKGKAGTHEGIRGEVDFDFNSSSNIDYARTVFVAGIKYGVLKEDKGLITWFKNGEPHKEVSRIPFDMFLQGIRENWTLDYDIRREILSAAGISCRYKDR